MSAERLWLSRVVKVVTHECTVECRNAITVQRNRIKFGSVIAHDSGSLSPKLGLRSSFSVGVMKVLP